MVFLILGVMSGAYFAIGIFFKPTATAFGWSSALISGAVSVSLLMHGAPGIIMGRLTDRFGPRLVLTICGLLMGLGYFLMSQVSSVWQLYLSFGVIIGSGMGGSIVSLLATISRWFTRRRGVMTGIVLVGTGLGTLIASPVTNWLIYTYGLRQSYIILGGVVMLSVIIAAQFLRRDPAQMGLSPYGETGSSGERLETGAQDFSLRESFHTRQFWLVCVMYFCFGFLMLAGMIHTAPNAIEQGMSPATAANILAAVGGLVMFGRVLMGLVADRIGNKGAFIICFILSAFAFFWGTQAKQAWALYIFAGVFGFAYGGMGASEAALVAGLFGLKNHGLIYGAIKLGFFTGAALGPFLLGYLFDVTGGYSLAFTITGFIGITGFIFTLLVKPIKGKI